MESATATFDRDRREGVETGPAPVVAQREEAVASPVTRLETWGIFLVFGIFYTLVGYWVVADLHVVSFDALDRLTRAFMVWYNDPPKLAAIGFSLPPIGTFVLVPFAAIRELVTSGLAIPLSSAFFGALALTSINRMFAMADMARGARLLIVLLIGINPMWAFYSMNGTGDAAYMFFVSFALFCLVGWGRNGSARYLIGAGLAFSLAVLTRYEYVFWAIFIAFLVSATLTNKGRDKDEVEGSVIAYLAPIIYTLGIWFFLNSVVLGDPFAWISQAGGSAPVNAISSSAPDFALGEAIGNALRVQLIFPVALILISIGYSVASAAVAGSVDVIELRNGLPTMVAGCAGIAWVYLRSEASRALVWGITVAIGVVALPLAWSQMKTFPHQNLEEAFTRAIATGEDQEGTASRGGFVVGISPETEMANYIDDQDLDPNLILTDNARTYGVIALTGQPELFFDRVDKGDIEWRSVLANPQGKVEYMLVDRTEADLILDEYPGADEGQFPGLDPVVSNDRYALLEVDEAAATTGAGADAPATTAPPADSTSAPPPSG